MKVTVVGAGFSGLTSAYYLQRAGFQVTVIEKSDRPGGLIQTLQTPWGLCETAANGLLNSETLQELAAHIKVPFLFTRPQSRRRYIYRKTPRRWPLGPFETLGTIKRYIKTPDRAPREGETIQQWGHRVLGQPATDNLLAPALQGIYAGDASRLSASLILSRFFNPGQKKKRGPLGLVAPAGGMGSLMKGLESHLRDNGAVFRYREEKKHFEESEITVLAVPGREAGELLDIEFLRRLETVSLVTATVYYRSPSLQGFGCLFPKGSGIQALGVLLNDQIFEKRSEQASETWILGGAGDLLTIDLPDEDILRMIANNRERLIGRRDEILGWNIQRWPRALPHYTVDLEESLRRPWRLELENKGIFLIGNYLGSIGLSQILEMARQLPEKIKKGDA